MTGPDLLFLPDFVPAAERAGLFTALMAEVPFAPETIRMFGRPVLVPRLVAWHGDPQARYVYSGTDHVPRPWTPALADLRDRLQARLDRPFNSVLANLYRGPADAMGWHADDEPELGPEPVIASLSFGAARRFRLKPRRGITGRPVDIALTDGSLLVMRGRTQADWLHAVPRETGPAGPRINLTFRLILGNAAATPGNGMRQKRGGPLRPPDPVLI